MLYIVIVEFLKKENMPRQKLINTKNLMIRMPIHILEKIKYEAEKKGISRTQLIIHYLLKGLKIED